MNRPIRVLAFLEAHTITGPAKAIVELARETARADAPEPRIEIVVATFLRKVSANDFTRAIEGEGIPLEAIAERRVFDPGVFRQMRKLVEKRQPDVIWTHAVKSHFLVRAAGLQKRVPWLASFHGYTTTDLKVRLYNQLDRWSQPGAKCVLTVCEKFAGDLVRLGVQRSRIRVQHNPIRTPEPVSALVLSELRRMLAIDDKTRVILAVGRLSEEKGHADLIRGFARLCAASGVPPLRLILVGDGPERDRLQALCRTLHVSETVHFAGQQADVRPYYALADIFVLPSLSEGSPNVLLEAMDAGIPVVATSVGGIPEIVTHDHSALLVPAHNSEAIASAMTRLLSDLPLRARLTAAARETLKLHTPESYSQQIRSLLAEVAEP